MRTCKLLKITEEIVPLVSDHLIGYHRDSNWHQVNAGESINVDLSVKQYIVPITRYCRVTDVPQEGYECETYHDQATNRYTHTTYVAIDHNNSEFLKLWFENHEKDKVDLEYKCKFLESEKNTWMDDAFRLGDKIDQLRYVSLWDRIKWVFTGVKFG